MGYMDALLERAFSLGIERPAQAAVVPGLQLSGFPRQRRVVTITSSAPISFLLSPIGRKCSLLQVLCVPTPSFPARAPTPDLGVCTPILPDSAEGLELTSAPVEAVGGPGSPWLGLCQRGCSVSSSRLRAKASTRPPPPLPPSLSPCPYPQSPQLCIRGISRSEARAHGSRPRRPGAWAA